MRRILPALLAISPVSLAAQDLRIVTDIAPIHSLVSLVAGPDAQIDVLVSGGASPHDFQFSFDQATAVEDADVVIWAGEALTPWLHDALDTLAADTPTLELLETGGWTVLDLREDAAFAASHAGHDHDDHDGDMHDEHEAIDPHAWLDPRVAMVWVDHIRDTLSAADPDRAAHYAARAEFAQGRLAELDLQLSHAFEHIPQAPYLVPHDAYQYFEARVDRPAAGAISLSDASTPSPSRITELRDLVADGGITCILTDPQARRDWVDLVAEGTDVRTALADPMGGAFEAGELHYFETITAVTDAYFDCLNG